MFSTKQPYLYLLIIIFLVTLSGCTAFSSCGSNKEAFIQNFYTFVEDIRAEQKKGTISDQQWGFYDEQFKTLTEKCYPKFEKELKTDDQLGLSASIGFYFYAKYGVTAVLKLAQTDAAIKKILLEIDYKVLINMATEIINNPDEIHKIMGDLEKRYGDK